MAARAIWKATIRFGRIEVPVKLYSAIEDRSVHFRLLDAKTREPVRQKMIDPATEEAVDSGDVRKAFEPEQGELVILGAEELEELVPKPSRDIAVTRFVPPEEITHQWYDRPYYLGPDGDEPAYSALVEALRRKDREGVAHWVMRGKEYKGALRRDGDYLMLITLRHSGEVVPASALEPPTGRALAKPEIEMAKQLIAAMEDEDLDLASFTDEYRDRVLAFIEAKAAGKVVRFPRAPKKAKEESLEKMLKKSLKATESRSRASA